MFLSDRISCSILQLSSRFLKLVVLDDLNEEERLDLLYLIFFSLIKNQLILR